jgi:hypothetical protein
MGSIMDKHVKKIKMYRNGDTFYTGKKVIVSTFFRNFHQFQSECSKDLNFVTGGVRRIYDIQGHRIRALDDLKDMNSYVATNGESFKKIDYPNENDLQPAFRGFSKENLNEWKDPKPKKVLIHRQTNRSCGGLNIEEKLQAAEKLFNSTVKVY